jgi:hypothetical protein
VAGDQAVDAGDEDAGPGWDDRVGELDWGHFECLSLRGVRRL